MNMREVFINRKLLNEKMLEDKQNNDLKLLGFIDYKRTIQLFIKEIERINGIPDRKVQEIATIISNYSVTKIDCESYLYNKTVYLCDVEFPKDLNMESIVKNVEQFVQIAYIRPTYAFQTAHIIKSKSNKFIDLGLTMSDLSVPGTCGIVNFSDNTNEYPKFKDYIYGNSFNPKFYNNIDNCYEEHKQRSGNINEFVDSHTKIFCNTFGSTTVENFINDNVKTGIYINNRTRTLNEFINDMFQKLLHIGLEKIELVIRKQNGNIEFNVVKCGFFAKFDNSIKEYFIEDILSNCEKQMMFLDTSIDENFYMVYTFDTKFAILDYFYKEDGNNKEVRISKPIYHLYNEFSIDTESIINNVELSGSIAKADMIETVVKENALGLGYNNDIQSMIALIDQATYNVLGQIEQSNSDRARLSMDDKSLWQRKLLE